MMRTSKAGIELIKGFEAFGLPGKPGEAYQDSVGVWTIGYGHTAAAGPPIPLRGMKITEAEGQTILARDLSVTEGAVTRLCIRVPTQAQFDAMVSLTFNEGESAFAGSSVRKFFNLGLIPQAADAFLLWDKETKGGKLVFSQGLLNRREKEKAFFLSVSRAVPVTPAPIVIPPKVVVPPLGFWARLRLWFFGAR